MLNLTKTTPCGRFTVTIKSNIPDNTAGIDLHDCARSLKNLSDVLIQGSETALRAAVDLLEAHRQPSSRGSSS